MPVDEQEDQFELTFRLFGAEVFGVGVKSQSNVRNWAVVCILGMVLLVAVFAEYGPAIKGLLQ